MNNKNEQLAMDFDSNSGLNSGLDSNEASASQPADDKKQEYEHLDIQLAQLMQRLDGGNDTQRKAALKQASLEISKHTREGQIALPCDKKQQAVLFNSAVVGKAGDYKPLIIDEGFLYLRRYWQYQQQLADQINQRIQTKPAPINDALKARLDDYFLTPTPTPSSTLLPENQEAVESKNWQKIAAEHAIKNQFLIVSGGPGTGKTTTITRILALLIESFSLHKNDKKGGGVLFNPSNGGKLKILLAAPTGKAAIRMLDAVREAQTSLDLPEDIARQMPQQATTIHKLLGYIPEKVGFKHNRNKPLNADVVLVDEASMIDIALMSKLVEAVPADAKLILIGDKNQLSSVETGSVFSDICAGLHAKNQDNNQDNNIVTLQKNWRFSKDSGIGKLAHEVNQGNAKAVLNILHDDQWQECQLFSPEKLATNPISADLVTPWENYFQILKKPESTLQEIFEAFQEYRILCALRQGFNGSVLLNSRIETRLFNEGWLSSDNKQAWYHGRPVMVTQNDYSKGLFNGDTGIALSKNGKLSVWFPSDEAQDNQRNEAGFKAFSPIRLPAHETTWSMTIHKSQGSEFNEVALVLPHEEMPLLTRQLVYTGVTRAKKQLRIIASQQVLSAGVKTTALTATQIAEKLRSCTT